MEPLEKKPASSSDHSLRRSNPNSPESADIEKGAEQTDSSENTTVTVAPGTDEASTGSDAVIMSGIPLVMFTIGMMAVVFLMCLDHYILATATPRITSHFNSIQDAAWYSSGYYLTNMAVQPAFGQLFKLFSVRLAFLACILIFEVGSIICALAPSSAALIIGRLITGVGGGGLYIGSVAIVGSAIPGHRRPLYISMITSLDGVASFVGPLLGGALTDSSLTWRFCFWINVPIGFVAFGILWWFLRDPPRQASDNTPSSVLRRLARWTDVVYAWSDPRVYGLLVTGGILLAVYFVYQHYQGENAAIPYRILRNRTVFFSAAFMLLINVLVGSLVYYLPFEFQAVRGESATKSGITNIAFLVPLLVAPLLSSASISLTKWYVPQMQVSSAITTVGAGFLTTLDGATSDAHLIRYQLLTGLAGGFCHQIPYTSILDALPMQDVVPGSALCSFLNSLGSVVGIVIAQVIFAGLLLRNLEGVDGRAVLLAGPTNIADAVTPELIGAVRSAYSKALQATYYLPVIAAGLSTLCVLGMRWRPLNLSSP
ncbi:major facilitator superfamily domain-containing protein [Xylariaceae sp. FL0594]|nr:major facilitator superfamily domain-containing protein [Xylariaceae sp. FL0594]